MNKPNLYIALLRGINVGGHHKIKMDGLRRSLQSIGLKNVQTYLASGNVVFESDITDKAKVVNKISAAVETDHDLTPRIMLLTVNELQQAVDNNPFPDATEEPRFLHFGFLARKPVQPDLPRLKDLKKDSERFELIDNVFYLHAPDGVGRSKLAAGSEKALGVPMTDRNWKTVKKVIEMAEEVN